MCEWVSVRPVCVCVLQYMKVEKGVPSSRDRMTQPMTASSQNSVLCVQVWGVRV